MWLYLKNYDILNEFMDSNILVLFLKLLMDPKSIKPEQIKQIMAQTYLTFGTDSEDVQHEWRKYTKKIDKKVGAMCVILRVEGLGVGFLGV